MSGKPELSTPENGPQSGPPDPAEAETPRQGEHWLSRLTPELREEAMRVMYGGLIDPRTGRPYREQWR